ncbi:hypothetical protein Tco_1207533, partial [Tanacetum coccineum]
YPTNRDDEEEEPSEDEADDEDEDDEEEEEEHPASAESVPPPPVHRTKARISILAQAHVPFLSKEEVERFLAISTPPPSPLTPLSSPLPQIPSSPLPVSPPLPVSSPPPPASPTYPLGFRVAMIWLRAETPSTSHPLPSSTSPSGTPPLLPILLPTSSPPLIYPLLTVERTCPRPTGGFRPDYGFVATLDDEIRRDPERDVGYGITDTWDEMLVGMPGAPTAADTELGRRMTEFATMVMQDIDEIYGRLDEAQDARVVLSGRLNLLKRDRCSHAYTALLMEREARLSCEAWGRSMDASDTTHSEVRALRTTVLAQQTEIAALRAKMAPKRATRSTPATTTTTTSVTNAQLKALIDQGVANALAACDADISMNGDDNHNSGTGGTEGVIELTQWFKRMENVFRISNCFVENQIKFVTCTLLGNALTWWKLETDIREKDEKPSQKRQNRARNGKAWKSQSQIEANIQESQSQKSTRKSQRSKPVPTSKNT